MTFGAKIKKEFDIRTAGAITKINEEYLFNSLIDSFQCLSSYATSIRYETKIVHGTRGVVKFLGHNKQIKHVKSPDGKILVNGETEQIDGNIDFAQCEIADIVFLIYSKKQFKAKITFLQCKYSQDLQLTTRTPNKIKFKVDIDQLALLKGRPVIEKGNRKNAYPYFATDEVFNGSNMESIGSYGVFFRDNNKFDMIYSSADLINYKDYPKCLSSRKLNGSDKHSITAQLNSSLTSPYLRYKGNHADIMYCSNLEDFCDMLVDFKVGKLLELDNTLSFSESLKMHGVNLDAILMQNDLNNKTNKEQKLIDKNCNIRCLVAINLD